MGGRKSPRELRESVRHLRRETSVPHAAVQAGRIPDWMYGLEGAEHREHIQREAREHRPKRRICAETGKVTYGDEVSAGRALARAQSDPSRTSVAAEIRTYQCQFCKHWHLTSQERLT